MAYGNPQRLYVIEIEGGLIKPGISSLGALRMQQHARNHVILRHFYTEKFVVGARAEAELLARIAKVGVLVRGREWFSGISFEDATDMARAVADEFEHSNPQSKQHLLRKTYAALRFNDQEHALLDAYCEKFGLERGAACRKLALEAVRARGGDVAVHAADSLARH